MVGGRNFAESQFNRVMQSKRQAGSAFKPFVFAAALESGYTPSTMLTGLDEPVNIPGGTWLPDDGHSEATAMTVRAALRVSSNRAAVKMLREVGIPRAVSYAKKLGLEAPPVPALVLGAGDVTALQMASAYGAFANGGWLREPIFIRRVEDANGRVLFTSTPKATPAITPETAFLMAQMLADAMNAGTGYRAREAGFRFPAAGKTGTTNEYRDAWFIGFTPALVTSVWVGFDEPRTIAPGGYAGQLAAPIWGRFMKTAVKKDAGWIKRPEGIVAVEICRVSGGRATDMCRRAPAITETGEVLEGPVVVSEYFRRGTEPADCPIHTQHPVCSGCAPVDNPRRDFQPRRR
jgi:penicillin-binding protein 1A